jgi:hypothetical protein
MDFNKFSDLRSIHMDSIGAAVVQCASLTVKSSSTSWKKYLNCATIGTRDYAHLRLLSDTNFTFLTNAQNPDTSVETAHHEISFSWPLCSFTKYPINNIQPPQVQLGVIVK